MKQWQLALTTVLERIATYQLTWMVVGSVASVIRGCQFDPRDLDLLVPDYPSLEQLADLVHHSVAPSEKPSIQTQEFSGGFKWHKLYWDKEGFAIDASFIESGGDIPDSEDGDGVWEGGKLIWQFIEQVNYAGYLVPVPPLSVQLESQLRRERLDRAQEIRHVMQAQGYSQTLARRCLSKEHYLYLTSDRT